MSQLGNIVDALVADAVAALTAYSVQGNFEQLQSINADRYPLAMVFNPAATGGQAQAQQLEETTSVSILLLRQVEQGGQMRTDVEALISQVEADPTLGGIVEGAFFNTWAVEETFKARTIGAMILETKRIRF